MAEKETSDFLRKKIYCFLLAFTIPLVIRVLPEILMGSYIIGFDPIGYYIPTMLSWLEKGVGFWCLMEIAPLFYIILMPVASLGIIPLVLTLKILPPFLHGLLGLSIYFYARKVLVWSQRKSLLTTLLATLYFVALRISWDLLRNELGLTLLFTTLTLLHNSDKLHRVLASLTMVSVVLTHQLVTVILFAIVIVIIGRAWIEKNRSKIRSLTIIVMPAVLLFLLSLYARIKMLPTFPKLEISFSYGMALTMLAFTAYCFWPLSYFAVKGFRNIKNLQLKAWTLTCLTLTFIPILNDMAYRWVLMLVYPLAFFSVEGLSNLRLDVKLKRYQTQIVASFIIIVMVISGGFMVMPNETPFPYTVPQFQVYMPSSMLQNTVPLSDCQHVVNSLNWLKNSMDENSVLLTHTVFHGWSLLTLNMDQVVPYGYGNPESVAENVSQQGYDPVYLIWWTEGQGWHGQPTAPASFKEVYRSGNIGVYIY